MREEDALRGGFPGEGGELQHAAPVLRLHHTQHLQGHQQLLWQRKPRAPRIRGRDSSGHLPGPTLIFVL